MTIHKNNIHLAYLYFSSVLVLRPHIKPPGCRVGQSPVFVIWNFIEKHSTLVDETSRLPRKMPSPRVR